VAGIVTRQAAFLEVAAQIPVALYMHENQLTYPWRPGEGRDLTYAMINWQSQLAADAVIFNSRFHQDAWFGALPNLLKHYPDYNHTRLVETVRARSHVLPVGIEAQAIANAASQQRVAPTSPIAQSRQSRLRPSSFGTSAGSTTSAPTAFLRCSTACAPPVFHFRLAVAGENFRQAPAEFEAARAPVCRRDRALGLRRNARGVPGRCWRAPISLISTADHEFFGISVLEAMAAGAFPILPARLSYPELIPPAQHTRLSLHR
jgi:hypothetical protein